MIAIKYKIIKSEEYNVPKNGNYHIITFFGDHGWFVNGRRHRDNDLPAFIYFDGTKYWHNNGLLHRINNPAIVNSSGTVEYWYNGILYSKQEYFNLMLDKGLITEKEYFAKLL